MEDKIRIHRPDGPVLEVDRWTLQEILGEARRTRGLEPRHHLAIENLIELLCQ